MQDRAGLRLQSRSRPDDGDPRQGRRDGPAPHAVEINEVQGAAALDEWVRAIIQAVRTVWTDASPNFRRTSWRRGSSSPEAAPFLKAFPSLSAEQGIPAHLADEPMSCVAIRYRKGAWSPSIDSKRAWSIRRAAGRPKPGKKGLNLHAAVGTKQKVRSGVTRRCGVYTAGSGMLVEAMKADIAANNLANADTRGFKRQNVSVRSFPKCSSTASTTRSKSARALSTRARPSAIWAPALPSTRPVSTRRLACTVTPAGRSTSPSRGPASSQWSSRPAKWPTRGRGPHRLARRVPRHCGGAAGAR